MMLMLMMYILWLARPQAALINVYCGSLRESAERRVSCVNWHPWMHNRTRVGAGDFAAHPFAESRQSARSIAAAARGCGGSECAWAAAGRAGGGDNAGLAASGTNVVTRRGVLAEAPAVAEGVVLLLLRVVARGGGKAEGNVAAACARAVGGGGVVGVTAGASPLGAGVTGASVARGTSAAVAAAVAASEVLPAAEGLAVRADHDHVRSGRFASTWELPAPWMLALRDPAQRKGPSGCGPHARSFEVAGAAAAPRAASAAEGEWQWSAGDGDLVAQSAPAAGASVANVAAARLSPAFGGELA